MGSNVGGLEIVGAIVGENDNVGSVVGDVVGADPQA